MALHTDRTKVDKSIMVPAYEIFDAQGGSVNTVGTRAEADEWISTHPGTHVVEKIMVWPQYLIAIEMMMLAVEIGRITEANATKFWKRVTIWERLMGYYLKANDGNGNLTDAPITLEQVRSCIGLHSNVFPELTDAKYRAKLVKIMTSDATHKLHRVELIVDEELKARSDA